MNLNTPPKKAPPPSVGICALAILCLASSIATTMAGGRAVAWGNNSNGQLGDNSTLSRSLAVSVTSSGVLLNKTVVAVAGGPGFSLALCSDGTLAAWGQNTYGQLGNNSTAPSLVPIAVNSNAGSAIYGKTVTAISAGGAFCLALCSDGTVAAWGRNNNGQLGNGTTGNSSVPVAVSTAGSLSGKTVKAISSGSAHNLALCTDGTLVAWGFNIWGQIGDNSTTQRLAPVQVSRAGVLAGKIFTSIAAGSGHNLVLCSDGTVASWGDNASGELGVNDMNMSSSSVPVAVNMTSGVSALFGKSIRAIAAGSGHSLALSWDGTVASWGDNTYGQLGDNSPYNRFAPVAVDTTAGVSALSGKIVTALASGNTHCLALCSDGSMAAWGWNSLGQIGDNSTTDRIVPVAVNMTSLLPGEQFSTMGAGPGAAHTLAVVEVLPTPLMSITGNGLTINGNNSPQAADGTEFGTIALGESPVMRTFSVLNTGTANLSLTGTPTVVISGAQAADFTVTQTPATSVAATNGSTTFQIAFSPQNVGTREATVSIANDSALNPYTFRIQGTATSGEVTLPGHLLNVAYTSSSVVPITTRGFTATGNTVNFSLGHTPVPGEQLMVVKNTAITFINGTFDNLNQGQEVVLTYAGVSYNYVANYYGGNGNDLVLAWANTQLAAWGYNTDGQLGDGTNDTQRLTPVLVTTSGVLAGKTVLAISASSSNSIALCSDGTVATWGDNSFDQLGNNIGSGLGDYHYNAKSLVPIAVYSGPGSALVGKRVVAVSMRAHAMALCDDGSVVTWGDNPWGELGDNTQNNNSVPVSVNTDMGVSALYGKTVVTVSAGGEFSLALCSDGTVASWGCNHYSGELGNNSMNDSWVPVAVDSGINSALHGKSVTAISAGDRFSLALCSDGTLVAWGDNSYGQLGDASTTTRLLPVAVNTGVDSALHGKTIVAISAGGFHSLALCSDGTVAAWGCNLSGELGDTTSNNSLIPVIVYDGKNSAINGKFVTAISAGERFADSNLTLCSDGSIAAWGLNTWGQLGDNSTVTRYLPVAVNAASLAPLEHFVQIDSGGSHSLAIIAATGDIPLALPILHPIVTGNVFSATFAGIPGTTFTAHVSTDLINWSILGSVTETSAGQFQFSDPQAISGDRRFYRVSSP